MSWIQKNYAIVIFFATSILVAGYLFFYPFTSRSHPVFDIFTSPFLRFFHQTQNHITSVINKYFYLVNLKKENVYLKKRLAQLEQELSFYMEESVRYHRLKTQLEFARKNTFSTQFADVIGQSLDSYHRTLFISLSRAEGIKRNFAVMLQEGVVGRIQSVSNSHSSVQLILDQRMRFPALIQRTRGKGIVFGTHDGVELRQISRREEIKVGDRIVTSGLSGIFPKGLLVGTISSIKSEDHALFQTAKIQTAVDFEKIEGVFVIANQNLSLRLSSQ